jgi:RNA polymerase sigma factor (TIGR02999 family)
MQWAYPQLHDIAVHHFRIESPGRTLQPTALINEMCLRFFEEKAIFKNRRYFFRAASTAMRRVLVDRARGRRAKKRGGDWQRVDFGEAERIGFEQPTELLNFDAALKRLQTVQPRWGEVVELRVFGQLSTVEVASVLGIAQSTAGKHWTRAKAWLRDDLKKLRESRR